MNSITSRLEMKPPIDANDFENVPEDDVDVLLHSSAPGSAPLLQAPHRVGFVDIDSRVVLREPTALFRKAVSPSIEKPSTTIILLIRLKRLPAPLQIIHVVVTKSRRRANDARQSIQKWRRVVGDRR
jgi:hypothetical protein